MHLIIRKKSILFFLLWAFSFEAAALSWKNLWVTPDQQAQHLMNQKRYIQAKERFQQKDWRAVAAFRSGDYQIAAREFSQLKHADGYYNQGNALAYLHQYQQALIAYNHALALNPKHLDAQYNRKIMQALLKKEPREQTQQNKQSKQPSPSNNHQQETNKAQQNLQTHASSSAGAPDRRPSSLPEEQQPQKLNHHDQATPTEKKTENRPNSASSLKPVTQPKDQNADVKSSPASTKDNLKNQQAEQWLRLIPDDPSGFLREKFYRDYERQQQR